MRGAVEKLEKLIDNKKLNFNQIKTRWNRILNIRKKPRNMRFIGFFNKMFVS